MYVEGGANPPSTPECITYVEVREGYEWTCIMYAGMPTVEDPADFLPESHKAETRENYKGVGMKDHRGCVYECLMTARRQITIVVCVMLLVKTALL